MTMDMFWARKIVKHKSVAKIDNVSRIHNGSALTAITRVVTPPMNLSDNRLV